MDRRRFLLGAVAVGAAACSAPERDLLTGVDVDGIELEPGADPTGGPVAAGASTTTTEGATPDAPSIPDEDLVDLAFVANAVVPSVDVHDEPGTEPRTALANPIPSGGPLVFLVEESIDDWHRVLLPLRPNGSTGWVRADQVTLTRHNYRILVELADFRLRVFDRGEVFVDAPVGVARDNTPTPGGRYYITELLEPPVPDSVYGPFAYGLSGYSEVLVEFAGGPGQLGIHGTNDPTSIGQAVSAGCIRLRNDDIERLVPVLPLGVPVEVRV